MMLHIYQNMQHQLEKLANYTQVINMIFVCALHEVPCCVSRVNEVQKACPGIKHINNALENVKSSYSIKSIESSLEKLLRNYVNS